MFVRAMLPHHRALGGGEQFVSREHNAARRVQLLPSEDLRGLAVVPSNGLDAPLRGPGRPIPAIQEPTAELGVVFMVGGNIAHVTSVLTTTIALETNKGEIALAIALAIILLLIVSALSLAVNLIQRHKVKPLIRLRKDKPKR